MRGLGLALCAVVACADAPEPVPTPPNAAHALDFECAVYGISVLRGALILGRDDVEGWDLDALIGDVDLRLPSGVELSCRLGR